MLNLKTVLPNFIKTIVFLSVTTLGFAANAAHHEKAIDAAVEKASEMADDATEVTTGSSDYSSESIGDLKDLTTETIENEQDEADDTTDE